MQVAFAPMSPLIVALKAFPPTIYTEAGDEYHPEGAGEISDLPDASEQKELSLAGIC